MASSNSSSRRRGRNTKRHVCECEGKPGTIIGNFDPGQRHYVRGEGSGDKREQHHYPHDAALGYPRAQWRPTQSESEREWSHTRLTPSPTWPPLNGGGVPRSVWSGSCWEVNRTPRQGRHMDDCDGIWKLVPVVQPCVRLMAHSGRRYNVYTSDGPCLQQPKERQGACDGQ